jgi:hypothetical protein
MNEKPPTSGALGPQEGGQEGLTLPSTGHGFTEELGKYPDFLVCTSRPCRER